MEQSRILDLLSLGLLDDNEASLKLTGQLPPAGYTPKSGTMFRSTQAQAPIANPASGTSTMDPTTPQQPKGPAKKP
jgi:hypothetical protein